MKNNQFNLNRFGLLLGKETADLARKEWRSFTFLTVFFLFQILFALMTDREFGEGELRWLSGFSVIFIWLIPSMVYGDVNDRQKGIPYAMLPASSLEKFLSMFAVSTLIGPAFFGIFLMAVEGIVTLLTALNGPEGLFSFSMSIADSREFFHGLLITVVIQSGFVLGNLVFRKHKLMNTILWVVVLHGAALVLVLLILDIFFEGTQIQFLFEENTDRLAYWLRIFGKFCEILYLAVLPVTIYLLSFFRIRNLQYR